MRTNNGAYAPHPNEIENRIAMAERLTSWIRVNMPSARAANLTALREGEWDRMAHMAGERPPSVATISVVVALLWERERQTEAVVAAISGALATEPTRLLARFDRAGQERL